MRMSDTHCFRSRSGLDGRGRTPSLHTFNCQDTKKPPVELWRLFAVADD